MTSKWSGRCESCGEWNTIVEEAAPAPGPAGGGLARGGSLDNALVFTEEDTLNPMRYPDELPRHKVLDIVGDLFLFGRIIGRVVALNSSHELNAKMAQKLRAIFKE